MKEKDTPMGKALSKAAPTFGSSGPGDEPVRVGVGQRPLTKEELFNGYLNSLEGLSPEAKIAALTAVGIGTAAAGQLVRGLSKGLNFSNKGLGKPMNPKDVASITSWQNDYQKSLKDFAKYTSQIPSLPQSMIDNIKQTGSQSINDAVSSYAAKEIQDAYDNYRVIPIPENKIVLDNAVDKYGGKGNIIVGEDSVTIVPNNKFWDATKDLRLGLINEEFANSSMSRAAGSLKMIQKWTGLPTAEAEALAAKPTVSGAVRSGVSLVGNTFNNALSFLRGGGGPKITGR